MKSLQLQKIQSVWLHYSSVRWQEALELDTSLQAYLAEHADSILALIIVLAPVGKGDGQLQIEAQIKYQLPVEGNLSCAGTAKMASKAKKSPSYANIAYIKEIDIVNSENIENVV